MYAKLIGNDFKKKPWKNFILLIFMCFSVAITATAALMLAQLFTSIRSMYEIANPPHFLQMHMGNLDTSDLDDFNRSYDGVTHWQNVPMIDLYGDDITITGKENAFTLSDCRLDLSFVKQNETYDVLLDADRLPLRVDTGEVYVPVILLEQYEISQGDKLTISANGITREFIVSGYVYDSMMNSTMCSSTRFLLSDQDFDELIGTLGQTEYMIEVWFEDSGMSAAYQTAYEDNSQNLPKSGQAITYQMIFILSSLTDMMTAFVFILAGVLLIAIAILCLRYCVLAELTEDVTEIGTMKAIGIPDKNIRNLYLYRISALVSVAGILGLILAFLAAAPVSRHIQGTFGYQPLSTVSICLAAIASVAVCGIILLCAKKTLGRIPNASVIGLLVRNDGLGGKKRKVHDGVLWRRKAPVNLLLGVNEARHGYGIILWLLLIVTFLMIFPVRTVQTMKQDEFITYMGSPICDLLAEVEQGEHLEERNTRLQTLLEEEMQTGKILYFQSLRSVRLSVINSEGKQVGVHIDTGTASGKGIRYLDGREPCVENELAISYLLAQELGKNVGEEITVTTAGQSAAFTLCGIYQDITSGGKTAKAVYAFPAEAAEKYTYQLMLAPDVSSTELATRMRQNLSAGYSIESMESFLAQTLGGVIARIDTASNAVICIGSLITGLIALLFMELRIVRETPALAEKIALGIPVTSICLQELYPVMLTGSIGVICGAIIAELIGDKLISLLFSFLGLGLAQIHFPAFSMRLLLIPLLLLTILAAVTLSTLTQVRKIEPKKLLNR